ncbi:2-keto-3-deoxygluconate permease [Erysipelothrix sp. HDW6A]|uniref:2-keto-3-deoxygluconate permease n=1 Tax=Erysipelothrix sp. HDW6A TaxID=2714928 RepID=UPI001409375D|nr:2-keto-3-deoxygluconate permease [Erysipelothrix sp. HDW6A]QIK57091.1 2-keto-3-deoxygluconate permease [Erysipelothrix sp. HDW6A]
MLNDLLKRGSLTPFFKRTKDQSKEKIKNPGLVTLVPLSLGLIINTFFPSVLSIGGPTSALFNSGSGVLMGMFLIICGAQIDIRKLFTSIYNGLVLLFLKLGFAYICAESVFMLFGVAGIWGITPFSIYCSIPSNNNSAYVSLSSFYGDESDIGAVSILSLKNGPVGTMLVMGVSGKLSISMSMIMGVLIPLLIGLLVGNLSKAVRQKCADAQDFVIFLMMFSTGCSSNLYTVIQSGFSGILLGILGIVVGVCINYVYTIFTRRRTRMGLAVGISAANSTLTPGLIASVDTSYSSQVSTVSAQCMTASLVTISVIPLIYSNLNRKKRITNI